MNATRIIPSVIAGAMLAACGGTSPMEPVEIPAEATMSNAGIWVPPPEPPEWPVEPPPRELPPAEQPPHDTGGSNR